MPEQPEQMEPKARRQPEEGKKPFDLTREQVAAALEKAAEALEANRKKPITGGLIHHGCCCCCHNPFCPHCRSNDMFRGTLSVRAA